MGGCDHREDCGWVGVISGENIPQPRVSCLAQDALNLFTEKCGSRLPLKFKAAIPDVSHIHSQVSEFVSSLLDQSLIVGEERGEKGEQGRERGERRVGNSDQDEA